MERINADNTGSRLNKRVEQSRERRDGMRGEEARYSLVLHGPRKNLGLTLNEYVLADTIHKLSSIHSNIPGWCYASKDALAEGINIPRRSLFRVMDKLFEKGLIEVHPQTRHLRTTNLWYQAVEVTKSRVFGPK